MVKRTAKYSKGCKVVAKYRNGGEVGGIGGGSGVDGSGNRGNGGYGGGGAGNQGGGGMGGGGKGGVNGTGVRTGIKTGISANNRPKPSAPVSVGKPRPVGAPPPKPAAPRPKPPVLDKPKYQKPGMDTTVTGGHGFFGLAAGGSRPGGSNNYSGKGGMKGNGK